MPVPGLVPSGGETDTFPCVTTKPPHEPDRCPKDVPVIPAPAAGNVDLGLDSTGGLPAGGSKLGLVDWLRSCPDAEYFQRIPSESTDESMTTPFRHPDPTNDERTARTLGFSQGQAVRSTKP
jgi:hypothetical protein